MLNMGGNGHGQKSRGGNHACRGRLRRGLQGRDTPFLASRASMNANKIKGFTLGNQTKSRFQKHKEEMEAKKKKEEEEAAKVFEDFVASFEGDGKAGGGKGGGGFVRGDVVNAPKDGVPPLEGGSAGKLYSMVPRSEQAASALAPLSPGLRSQPPPREEER